MWLSSHLISQHGIAMPKGVYFAAVVFSFFLSYFFFRRLISDFIERISTKLGHIFTYDCYLKNLVRTPLSIYSATGCGAKNRFFGPTLKFWPNIFRQRSMISTTGKKLVNLQGLLYMPPKFGKLCLPLPLNFRIGGHFQPYSMDVI